MDLPPGRPALKIVLVGRNVADRCSAEEMVASNDPGSRADGMVDGMATKKVTITLDEAQLGQIRSLVQAGTAASVSGSCSPPSRSP
jgi:hypothetical protein